MFFPLQLVYIYMGNMRRHFSSLGAQLRKRRSITALNLVFYLAILKASQNYNKRDPF